MEAHNNIPKLQCNECRKSIGYGGDAITTEVCVSGPRGLVSLGDKLVFCSEECLSSFYSDVDLSNLPKVPPRFP